MSTFSCYIFLQDTQSGISLTHRTVKIKALFFHNLRCKFQNVLKLVFFIWNFCQTWKCTRWKRPPVSWASSRIAACPEVMGHPVLLELCKQQTQRKLMLLRTSSCHYCHWEAMQCCTFQTALRALHDFSGAVEGRIVFSLRGGDLC